MTDFAARKDPAVFKPRIDAALSRLAAVGAQHASLPIAVPQGYGAWGYLTFALNQCRAAVASVAVKAALGEVSWSVSFLDDTWDQKLGVSRVVETSEQAPEGAFERAGVAVLEHYPAASYECLRQENFVGGADTDLFALWDRGDRVSVCHASPEGFWVLGEDPVDFIERIAAQASA